MLMSRRLQIAPASVLFERARSVERFDDFLRSLVDEMYSLMYSAHGVGLAAPQAGELLRVATIDLRGRAMRVPRDATFSDEASDEEWAEGAEEELLEEELFTDDCREAHEPFALINPEITWRGEELRVYEEGCLSFPDILVRVERPRAVEVSYYDLDGEQHRVRAHGLLSICLQHELDHLDGRTIIDSLSRLRRSMVLRRFTKQARLSSLER